MKQKLKILLVANNCNWPSMQTKIDEVVGWFSSKIVLDFTVTHTQFANVPFVSYRSSDPNQVNLTNLNGVEPQWYDKNVTALAIDENKVSQYDIVIFLMNVEEWKGVGARGWRTDQDGGVIQVQVGANEGEGLWVSGVYQGSTFLNYIRHEIMHCLFMLTGQVDTTHYWWDRWQLVKALDEVDFSYQNDTILKLSLYNILRTLSIKVSEMRQKVQHLNGEVRVMPDVPEPEKPSKLVAWAEATKQFEGWKPGSLSFRNNNPGNLRISKFPNVNKGGYCFFPDYQTGYNALLFQLQLMTFTAPNGAKSKVYNPEMTLREVYLKWTEDGPVVSEAYAKFVAKSLGVTPDTKIKELV